MAKNQRLLKETGLEALTDQLNSGKTVNQYTSGTPNFGLALTDFCWLNNFRVDDVKIKQMVASADSDVECAILLYQALPDLNGLFASYAPFWTHLSHYELFDYMKKRWPNITKNIDDTPKDVVQSINYIRKYWFYHGAMNSWLSSLWWSVFMTKDDNREDPYELTRVLFYQEDMRTRTLGTYMIFRHEPARIAILEFIRDNREGILKNDFQDKVRYLMKVLNLLGGSKQLAYMDKDYFVGYLNSKKDDIIEHYKD